MKSRILSTQEASQYLGITGKTLKEWDYKGILKPSFYTDGGHRRYLIDDLNSFINSGLRSKISSDDLEAKVFKYISLFAKGLIDLVESGNGIKDFPNTWKKSSVLLLELSKNYGLYDFEFPLTISEQNEMWKKPLSEWKIKLFDKLFSKSYEEPVLYDNGITDFCRELAISNQEQYDKEISAFLEIIDETRSNDEETEYRNIRQFLIEHPVINKDELDDALYLNFQGNSKKYRDKISELYENIPLEYIEQGYIAKCPYCGWTLKKTLKKFSTNFDNDDYFFKCNTDKCLTHAKQWKIKEKLLAASCYRVKRGIQEFVVEPGIIELNLYTALLKLEKKNKAGLKCDIVLYPECDFADLLISFSNKEKWVIDAKDWKMPQALAMNLNNKELFMSPKDTKFDKGIIVIPSTYGKDYLKILKAYWDESNTYEIWDSNELIEKAAEAMEVEI